MLLYHDALIVSLPSYLKYFESRCSRVQFPFPMQRTAMQCNEIQCNALTCNAMGDSHTYLLFKIVTHLTFIQTKSHSPNFLEVHLHFEQNRHKSHSPNSKNQSTFTHLTLSSSNTMQNYGQDLLRRYTRSVINPPQHPSLEDAV